MAQPRWLVTWPVVLALGVAAAWPLTAYAISPLLLPGLILLVTTATVVAWRPEYGIALALALAPWTNMVLRGNANDSLQIPGKPFHLVLPALGFGLVAYSLLVSRTESANRSPVLTGAVLFFVAAALASSMQALKPSSSVTKIFLLLTAAALFFAVTQVCRERRQLLVVVAGALAGLLLASGQGIVQHYTGSFGQFGFVADGGAIVKRVQGSFGHPNQYGGFIAILTPLAVAVVATRRLPTSMRWLAGVALSLSVLALIFSYARGAIAAVVIGSLLWLAFQRPRLAVAAAMIVAVAAIAFAPTALRERFNPQGVSGDVPLRADIWAAALDIYSDHPVLGVGVDNFSVAYEDLPSTALRASQRRLLHQDQLLTPPHAQNQYLNIMAEEGLVGLAALVVLGFAAVAVTSRGARVRDPLGRSICLGIGAGVMTLAVHSFLEAELIGEVALPLFALVAVAAGFVALDRDAAGPARSVRP